jgi:hypothetical protein
MAPNGRPRRRFEAPPAPTSLTECARRYHGAALALARTFGVPLTADFVRDYHPAISTIYIEAGRAQIRLPPTVQLPPLAPAGNPAPEPEPDRDPLPPGEGEAPDGAVSDLSEAVEADVPDFAPPTDQAPAPLTIPTGFPSAVVRITDLKPGVLPMLIAKTAALVHAEGEAWVPLLGALQSERATRLERGRKAARPGVDREPEV